MVQGDALKYGFSKYLPKIIPKEVRDWSQIQSKNVGGLSDQQQQKLKCSFRKQPPKPRRPAGEKAVAWRRQRPFLGGFIKQL